MYSEKRRLVPSPYVPLLYLVHATCGQVTNLPIWKIPSTPFFGFQVLVLYDLMVYLHKMWFCIMWKKCSGNFKTPTIWECLGVWLRTIVKDVPFCINHYLSLFIATNKCWSIKQLTPSPTNIQIHVMSIDWLSSSISNDFFYTSTPSNPFSSIQINGWKSSLYCLIV